MIAKFAFLLLGCILYVNSAYGQDPMGPGAAGASALTPQQKNELATRAPEALATVNSCGGDRYSPICRCIWMWLRYCLFAWRRHPLCRCVRFCPWPWAQKVNLKLD